MNEEKKATSKDQKIVEKELQVGDTKIKVKEQPMCRIELEIETDPKMFNEAYKKALKKVGKEVSVPGFRKGKVPQSMLLKKFLHVIQDETKNELAHQAFKLAGEHIHIPILQGHDQIHFHTKEFSFDEQKATLVFNFERDPAIPEIDYDKIELEDIPLEPFNEEVLEDHLTYVRRFFAQWNEIKDRGIQEGDFVTLDIDDIESDPPTKAFSNARFEVTKKNMAQWMRDLIIGKKVGESVEGISKPDENASQEDKDHFTEKKVRITIHKIEKDELPPLDDEFAKKLGADNVATLKERLSDLVQKNAQKARAQKLRDTLTNELVKKVEFEIPGSLLEKEANHRMQSLMSQRKFREEWDKNMTDEQKEAKKNEVIQNAKEAIRLFFLSKHLVQKHHIPLSEKELQEASSQNSLLELLYANPNQPQYNQLNEEQKSIEFSKLMLNKAEDYIIEHILSEKSTKKS